MYADDNILLSATVDGLQKMFDVCGSARTAHRLHQISNLLLA